jgi:hypothetical protein
MSEKLEGGVYTLDLPLVKSVPICRDCRWCRYPGEYKSPCFHDEAAKERVNFITGGPKEPAVLCIVMRGQSSPCGVEARLFEAREKAST